MRVIDQTAKPLNLSGGILTDIENLQKKENAMEEALHQRQLEIMGEITELFLTLSPTAQAELLGVLLEDESDNEALSEDDDE